MITREMLQEAAIRGMRQLVDSYNVRNDAIVDLSVEHGVLITVDGGTEHGAWEIVLQIEEV